MQYTIAVLLGIGVLLGVGLLASGHEVLADVGPFGISWGVIIAWGALIAAPLAQLIGLFRLSNQVEDTRIMVFKMAAWLSIALSSVWGAFGYGLSGNWMFHFPNNAGSFIGSIYAWQIFYYLTIAAALLPILILILYLIYRAL
ncbi:MAG: hypothetical protein KI786_18160 [Mameliella sp.]|nr:hypothetical protein [Phaeodactylibacter sp.]